MFYVIDHNYAIDHMEYCRVIKTSDDATYSMYDVAEILVAIQFYFEEHVDENGDPLLGEVTKLLEKAFGFIRVDKESVKEELTTVLNSEMIDCFGSYWLHDFGESTCVYLDMYEIRERMCAPGRPQKLYKKWLTSDIMEDIKKMMR